MKKIVVDFTNYKDIPFAKWCGFVSSEKSTVGFFCQLTEEEFNALPIYQQQFIVFWLGGLDFSEYKPQPIKTDIYTKTLRQKLDAVKACKMFSEAPARALPFLLAIFEQEYSFFISS